VPQAGPEPLTRSPRVSSRKNLLPIVLNGGCASLEGTRPLTLKCSSRLDVSTSKSPFQSDLLNELARKGYIPAAAGQNRFHAPDLLPCGRVVSRV
jgi:hypothetical protein